MSKIDINELEKKAEELQIMPFLNEMINFIKEVKPIVDNVNLTINDNVKKVPKATKKLTKVTEATEMATNEILNTVDGITQKSTSISELLNNIQGDENNGVIEQANNIINDINGDSMAIMMALQVQDITSQQIAAVNHLLTTMQRKLNAIVGQFNTEALMAFIDSPEMSSGTNDDPDTNISTLHREIAFDPEAIDALTKKDNRQDEVDALMQKHADGSLTDDDLKEDNSDDDDDIDVDDIDALFAAQAGIEEIPTEDDEEVSADDIDALFGGGGDSDDEVSQDDIDALFNQ